MTVKMHPEIRAHIDISYSGDDWGTAMGAMFSIADVLEHEAPDLIPSVWQYRHSPICDGPDESDDWFGVQLLELLADDIITAADVRTAGDIVNRWCDLLRAAGRDY
jgi:hypothetical protein